MSDFEGRCLCGGVRFAVAPPTLFFAHCHCRWCREAHGAAFVSWVGVAEERFRFLSGSAQPAFPGDIDREPECHVFFDQRAGYFRETANDQVMEKVDAEGNILGFSVLRVSAVRQKPLEVSL